jgi:hypothetical protein
MINNSMIFDYSWSMPNKNTFSIPPVAELLYKEMLVGQARIWIDPFARNSKIATITNDLNLDTTAQYHMDAVDFLKMFDADSIDGILYDPPYSLRQTKECYDGIGLKLSYADSIGENVKQAKTEIRRILKPEGKVISFGWNSIGMGKKRGFEKVKILLVCHGRSHNDTICVIEKKIAEAELWT